MVQKVNQKKLSFLGNTNIEELNQETKEAINESSENLKLANTFWFSKPYIAKEEFKDIIKEYQNADAKTDDFNDPNTLVKINNWVNENTNGLIEKILPELGVVSPFTNVEDFNKMLNISQVVQSIIHKTNFKLDENGTEAAAATAVVMMRGMAMPIDSLIEINLTFNRPFAFIIRHIKTNEILFIGKINNL